MAWTNEDTIIYIKSMVQSLRTQRLAIMTEGDCLSREINRLEEIIFKIEKESEEQL